MALTNKFFFSNFIFIFITLFIYLCSAAPCTYTATDGSSYDLSSLTKQQGGYVYTSNGVNFTYITGEVIGTGKCAEGTSVCQTPSTFFYSCGSMISFSIFEHPTNISDGVSIRYGNGTLGCSGLARETKFVISCDPTVEKIRVVGITEPSKCSYLWNMESKFACRTTPAATTGATTATTATTAATTTTTTTTAAATTGATTTTATSTSTSTTTKAPTTTTTTSATTSTTKAPTTTTGTTSTTKAPTTATTTTAKSTTTTTTTTTTSSPTTGGHSSTSAVPSSTTTGQPIHKNKGGKILIVVVVLLSVVVVVVSVLLVREVRRRRAAQDDMKLERLKLTGSTYDDVKKVYYK